MRVADLLLTLSLMVAFSVTSADQELPGEPASFTDSGGNEMDFLRYPADGEFLMVWIASGYALQPRTRRFAAALASNGIEVWQIDLSDALFLPHSTDQMRRFSGQHSADFIDEARRRTGKRIVIASRAYGAIPSLRGARIIQQRHPGADWLLGLILFSPDLYAKVPDLGKEPEYVPIASATNLPVMIYQDGKRGTRWYVDRVVSLLEKGGARTRLEIFPGVAAIFFEDDDQRQTHLEFAKLPDRMNEAITWLASSPRPARAATMNRKFKAGSSGLDHKLKTYRGKVKPLPLNLKDYLGKPYRRADFRGQVTIINFWATWCPPCVTEIPALNNLKAKMQGKPFELISINYMESPQQITDFLKRVKVEFPVLLDESGTISSRWRVIAFPSTFVIGPDGNIRYGVNAAIHWDNDEVVRAMEELAAEKSP